MDRRLFRSCQDATEKAEGTGTVGTVRPGGRDGAGAVFAFLGEAGLSLWLLPTLLCPEHKIWGRPAAQSTNFRGVVQPSNLGFRAGRLASGSHLRRPVSGGTAVLF